MNCGCFRSSVVFPNQVHVRRFVTLQWCLLLSPCFHFFPMSEYCMSQVLAALHFTKYQWFLRESYFSSNFSRSW
ncbi:hypothetical protein ONE63_006696 [Megalurothrips usitatus]|uniref:Uncharacterized protein n=1 Tax=Megalurothrips usitatus TaxID=439358 RepID=A0AAV7XU91_9NEOP|nr:hypothetical protein ONE63_006696 [Megalurothrips usitatus]